MHSGSSLERNSEQQTDLITIAEIVDFYCNTNTYSGIAYEAALKVIAENPYCWKHVEKQFSGSLVESKKKEILNAVEKSFSFQFPNNYKEFLLKDPFCTFKGIETIIRVITQHDQLNFGLAAARKVADAISLNKA